MTMLAKKGNGDMVDNLAKLSSDVDSICMAYDCDKTSLVGILRDVQQTCGCVSSEIIDLIANKLKMPRVEIESASTFYSFLSSEKRGEIVIRLCDDIIDKQSGVERVAEVFKKELNINFGETTKDGKFSLEWTPCIGMCDQAPSALINDVVVTHLSTDKAHEIIETLKATKNPQKLITRFGDGNNANPLVSAMVRNNIIQAGKVIFANFNSGDALKKTLSLSPVEVIREIKASRLRGRGGAGFPTGMKWEFTRAADEPIKTVICNADEGEPGTFKDRVILTERAELMIEGMTVAAYAIGAQRGILYLRGEYTYLRKYLESVLENRRSKNLLGKSICGKYGFNFDLTIQMGAGAYVCGEETALINSAEGKNGDPRNRPPFPAQRGFLKNPTAVNNPETYCCAAKIMDKGAGWFSSMGTNGSTGTKLLSISGDCNAPGVYEVNFGITIEELLKLVGADDVLAVQVGGPSGQLIGKNDFGRKICYDDLATGGAMMIFNSSRKILKIVEYFMDFFQMESCGYCTPCRVGNILLKNKMEDILNGKGVKEDIDYMLSLASTMKDASRCGLGQTSSNPVASSIKNFPQVYDAVLKKRTDGLISTFNISDALKTSEELVKRKSALFNT